MRQLPLIAFGWLLTVLTSWCAGKLLLRRVAVHLYRQEEDVMAFLIGSACLSTLIFLLCAVRLVSRPLFLAVALVVTAAGIQQRIWRPAGDRLPHLPVMWRWLFYGCCILFSGLYLIFAFAPEASPDGASYYLGLVARYAREGGFSAITTDFHASFPQGMEMLFLFAFLWGRHSAAALVHCTYLLLLPWLILNYGRRLRMPAMGAAGGLLVFAAPVCGIAGSSAYNDVALAAVAFAIFALLEIWREQRQNALLVLIGLLAGFAFALKYTGFIAFPYACAVAAYVSWRAGKPVLRPALVVAAAAVAIIAPTLIKNAIVVENPVSPFFNRVFQNPYVLVSSEEELSRDMSSYGVTSPWDLIRQVTVGGAKTAGVLGPVFLLAPLALLALRRPAGRRLLVAALVFLLPYPSNLGTRFLLPAASFLAPAMVMGLGSGIGVAALVVLHAFLSWPGNISWYCDRYCWRLDEIPIRAALRLETEDHYLRRQLGADYEMAWLIDRITPPGSRIFSFGVPAEAYCTREILPSFYAALNIRLRDNMYAAFQPWLQPRRALTFAFNPLQLRGVRLVQTGSVQPIAPAIHELRIFGAAEELPPQGGWRWDAHPFPWDAGLAFDRNPTTRWSTWQETAAGTWLAVDFEPARTVAAVKLETSEDQALVQWRLEGETDPGNWFAIEASSQQTNVAPPPDLRRAAISELKRNHIQYLLVDEDNLETEFQDHVHEWGIHPVGESEWKHWLYQIE